MGVRLTPLALLVGLVLVGCGGDEEPAGKSGKVGDLARIGEPATLPPENQGRSLTDREQPVVIASGRAPDGTPYEVVANRSVTKHPEPIPVPVGRDPQKWRATHQDGPVTCLTVDLPESPKTGTVEFCVGAHGHGLVGKTGYLDGVNFMDRRADFAEDDRPGPEARYLFTAELSPDIRRVEVRYEDDSGRPMKAYSDVGNVDSEIAKLIGTDDRIGYLVAFLPDDGLPPSATRQGPGDRPEAGVLGTVVLLGFDESGAVVARDSFGRRFAHRLEQQNRRLEAERTMRRRILAALDENSLGASLCMEALRAGVRGRARDACFDVLRKAHGPR